ncbi:uncharacterized protein LOC131206552 [Anopheles bellator]|uniref:uncharacterized protein LOC131206552 n=1 Tax=Anopheles bellator TaxID=139047 RepID=UPI0026483837|nr:uncharacterized protein LOC131206552 [Anopheles bellator]
MSAPRILQSLVCCLLIVQSVSGYAIGQPESRASADTERVIDHFRKRVTVGPESAPKTSGHLDGLQMLQLLPSVIRALKQDSLAEDERAAFQQVYGSLWELALEEAGRPRGQPRNAILKALFASPEIRYGRPDIRAELGNDIGHNSVAQVYHPEGGSKAIVIDDPVRRPADPSQRVLRMAAAIVQKYYLKRSKLASTKQPVPAQRRKPRNAQPTLEAIRVTIEMPRYKRSVVTKPLEPVSEDGEMEAKIWAAIKAQIGNPSGEDDDGEDEHDDGDSAEYLDDETDYRGVLGDDDDDDDEVEEADEVEEDIDANLLTASRHNFENPSFNELLMLAARHRAIRKQRQQQRKANTSDEDY